MDYETIFLAARTAARDACKDMPDTLPYGFAWVTVPATDGFARHCRRQAKATGGRDYGAKGYPSGWQFWNPGGYRGQSLDAVEVGAHAFMAKLAEHGIRADFGSRFD